MLVGCASRAVPFDKLETASVTVLKLQAAQPTPTAPAAGGLPNLPFLAPFLTPQMQAAAQPWIDQLRKAGIPIPGGAQPQPATPQTPMFRGQWQIAGSVPVADEATRDMLLDLFGNGDNFNNQMRCPVQTPGMAVSFQSPEFAEPVDVVVSISCNAVAGHGFVWPHQNNFGMAPTTAQQLVGLYQNLFRQQLPPGA